MWHDITRNIRSTFTELARRIHDLYTTMNILVSIKILDRLQWLHTSLVYKQSKLEVFCTSGMRNKQLYALLTSSPAIQLIHLKEVIELFLNSTLFQSFLMLLYTLFTSFCHLIQLHWSFSWLQKYFSCRRFLRA